MPPDRLTSASPGPPLRHRIRDWRGSGRHRSGARHFTSGPGRHRSGARGFTSGSGRHCSGARRVAGPSAVAGQAAVELVALLPLIALLLALAYQALLAGQAAWAAHVAARAAARANAVGTGATAAARAHLPAGLERGLRVHATSGGDVRVSVEVPRVLPALSLGHVAATAHFRPQDA